MILSNEDLILFSVHELLREKNDQLEVTLKDFASGPHIHENTLNVYLSKLRKQGLIHRINKHYEYNIIKKMSLTEEGFLRLENINSVLSNSVFTPENHKIDHVWKFFDIYNKYKNPIERIFILTLFVKMKDFDITSFISTLETSKDERCFTRIFNDHFCTKDKKKVTLSQSILNMSLYGINYKNDILNMNQEKGDINSLILLAEASRRRGEFEYANQQFKQLLKPTFNLTRNQWLQIQINLLCLNYELEDYQEVNKKIEYLKDQTKDIVLKNYLLEIEGTLCYFNKDNENAIKLLSSSIRSFHKLNEDFFLSLAYTNRGVVYFNMENFPLAEKDWKKALKYARNVGSKYSEANILPNLADIEIQRKNYKKAKYMLNKSEDMFIDLGCIRGRDIVEFNRALLYLEMKKLDKAIDHLNISETLSPSFPTTKDMEIRRDWFLKKANDLGLEIDKSLFKHKRK